MDASGRARGTLGRRARRDLAACRQQRLDQSIDACLLARQRRRPTPLLGWAGSTFASMANPWESNRVLSRPEACLPVAPVRSSAQGAAVRTGRRGCEGCPQTARARRARLTGSRSSSVSCSVHWGSIFVPAGALVASRSNCLRSIRAHESTRQHDDVPPVLLALATPQGADQGLAGSKAVPNSPCSPSRSPEPGRTASTG